MPFLPTPPPNEPVHMQVDGGRHRLTLTYNGKTLLEGTYTGEPKINSETLEEHGKISQQIVFHGHSISVQAVVHTGSDAFATETLGIAQKNFPLVRNSDGPSFNLRNNAVYDRSQDLLVAGPADGTTQITPLNAGAYSVQLHGDELHLEIKPRYYQKHKNVAFFEPWKHPLTRRPISGWCSWWAYRTDIDLPTVGKVAQTFSNKLAKFGYRIIQLDDGYQSGEGAPPTFWLKPNSKFPGGLPAIAQAVKKAGLEPGIWVGSHVFDGDFANAHPDWFVKDADGKSHKGPWIGYGVDGHNPEALKALYGPVWDEIRQSGFSYVKIDSLRHLLYDSLYPSRAQVVAEGSTPEESFRDYLQFARDHLDPKTYILACWGVLPEATGIADACRLGGDGFGPSTMQQYNSWNNVVWRNDPDHVDLQGKEEAIIRPTLVSMAGAQLLLSDKAEFYEDESNLEGAKRASPVPYTLPGQTYDYDPSKTNNLIKGLRNQNGGTNAGPLDASQQGAECPWWQLDVSRPFERWTVLARLSWNAQPEQQVKFSDLGLEPGRYAVYEFWSHRYLGEFVDSFPAEGQDAKIAHVYSIRKIVDHPQILSTNRHITQGGPDLKGVAWSSNDNTLIGKSEVVAGDPYEIRIRCAGRSIASSNHEFRQEGDFAVIDWTPSTSGAQTWTVRFK